MALRAVVCLASIPLACAALESELAAEVRELRALVGGLQSELADVRRENELRRAAEPPAPHRGLQTASSSSTRASITYDGATLRATAPLNVTTLHVDSVSARAALGQVPRVAGRRDAQRRRARPLRRRHLRHVGAYDTSTYKYAAPVRVYLVWMGFHQHARAAGARGVVLRTPAAPSRRAPSSATTASTWPPGRQRSCWPPAESAYVRVPAPEHPAAAFWEHHCEWGITLIAKY